ncbi:MAG: Holliday junction resolvase RecU [Lachnospiraceae bacterium]|nr:Holliday junction resolvase RecU [Lachnospiraceae bacterium]MEE3460533.1 Holliday junction resolvase RecU [Lachnospiraceae bacterium]
MPSWNSRGLRGSVLEESINLTNERLREKGLGLVQKIPTPITPIEFDKTTNHITLAYFEKKSTVDYIGVIQGVPVCFDAKECNAESFPLQNIHEHQIEFMKDFEAQEGIAFFIVYFKKPELCYYVPYRDAYRFYKRAEEGGPRHFKRTELDSEYIVNVRNDFYIEYLAALDRDLRSRS